MEELRVECYGLVGGLGGGQGEGGEEEGGGGGEGEAHFGRLRLGFAEMDLGWVVS